MTTTPISEMSSENSEMNEVTTPAVTQKISTVVTSTTQMTTLKVVSTSTSMKSTNATVNTPLMPKTTTAKSRPIIVLNSTASAIATTKSIQKSTTLITTTPKSAVAKNTTTSIIRKKLLPLNVTSTTAKPMVKTPSTISIKTKSARPILPIVTTTLPPKPTKSSRKDRIVIPTISPKSLNITSKTQTVTMKPNSSMHYTTTEAKINAQIMPHLSPSDGGSGMSKISIIIAICVILSAMLFVWKYFTTNKWNHFNSHRIEFKSNYPREGTDESLIRSDSFQIDTELIENETLIENDDGGGDGDNINASDNNCENAHATTAYDEHTHGQHTGPNAKRATIDRTKMKFSKTMNRCGRASDQYSEKRCLMNNTADDEQFDFTPQTIL